MAKQFTNAPKRPPLQGAKFGIPSPILESYAATQESSTGQVVSFTDTGFNNLDRCEVYFRGKIIRATCCHPGIEDGMNVNMIEQPRGVWWATVMQKSWYSRPLLELIQKGHGYQAAVEYLLSFGAKWRPRLIIIDKRGVEILPPAVPYVPLEITNDIIIGYDPSSWPYDDALFYDADTNGDGFVDAIELANWLAISGATPNDPVGTGHTTVWRPDPGGGFGLTSYIEFTFNAFGPTWSYEKYGMIITGQYALNDVIEFTRRDGTKFGMSGGWTPRFYTSSKYSRRYYLYSIRQPGFPEFTETAIWDDRSYADVFPDIRDSYLKIKL